MNETPFMKVVEAAGRRYSICDIEALEREGIARIGGLPFCIRVLVENVLRKLDGQIVTEDHLRRIAGWRKRYDAPVEIPFHPTRVLMQDFAGVPAVVDLAALRDVMERMGGDPRKINPLVPVDLIVDHSVQVDYYGTAESQGRNVAIEYQKNGERYALLKWAQKSFDNFRIIPPRSGICHQVNLEYLSRVIATREENGTLFACPESLVGTDSHTTMINGIGVLGWGVGGIEAEAVMLGQPYYMAIPEVIGVRLVGRTAAGVTATDMALHVTQVLRNYGVVEKFVEYFGPAMRRLSFAERATLANMAPEYGATVGFMPVDERTLEYLRITDRGARAEIVEACAKALGLFYTGETDPEYTDVVEIDLGDIQPVVAGPSRPHQKIPLSELKTSFPSGSSQDRFHQVEINGRMEKIGDGSVVMAALTSCTNTSNPYALMGAGLVARNAVKRGLRVPSCVKTVLAPGSKVVARYLESAGLSPYLEALGFHIAGFGCMVCIGNSGPLHAGVEQLIRDKNLNVAAVLSGNRNFEARIHPRIKSNFLASPPLVVAFALAGRIDIDFGAEPVGLDPNGSPVYLKDIWPADDEIVELVRTHLRREFFASEYKDVLAGDDFWKAVPVEGGLTFAWEEGSSYVKNPPYFEGFARQPEKKRDISGARVLLLLGSSVTTDHISPGGSIPADYPAGRYLIEEGIEPAEFNSYGARRGNHEVMMRGTFGNVRVQNKLVSPREGSFTKKFPQGGTMYVYDAAMSYKEENVPLLVLGGREYGTGSSRDWAAKGTALLGIEAVLAESFERIHRSNLIGMGVLPLTFREEESCESLGLDGSETFDISGIEGIEPRGTVTVRALKADGARIEFQAVARLDTPLEVAYFENGGILPFVLRKILAD